MSEVFIGAAAVLIAILAVVIWACFALAEQWANTSTTTPVPGSKGDD